MCRCQCSGAQVLGRLRSLLGVHVDVCPARVVLAGIHGHPVEGTVLLPYLGEMWSIA